MVSRIRAIAECVGCCILFVPVHKPCIDWCGSSSTSCGGKHGHVPLANCGAVDHDAYACSDGASDLGSDCIGSGGGIGQAAVLGSTYRESDNDPVVMAGGIVECWAVARLGTSIYCPNIAGVRAPVGRIGGIANPGIGTSRIGRGTDGHRGLYPWAYSQLYLIGGGRVGGDASTTGGQDGFYQVPVIWSQGNGGACAYWGVVPKPSVGWAGAGICSSGGKGDSRA